MPEPNIHPISIRLPNSTLQDIVHIERITGESRSNIIRRAIRALVASDAGSLASLSRHRDAIKKAAGLDPGPIEPPVPPEIKQIDPPLPPEVQPEVQPENIEPDIATQ